VDEVKNYLSKTSVNAPFFLAVGDSNYIETKNALTELGVKTVHLSDYCASADKPPNLDRLFGSFDFADIDGSSKDKRIVVVGLGEYLSIQGEAFAYSHLNTVKDKKIGNARVVLLLRGVSSAIQRIRKEEAKRDVHRYIYISDNTASDINVAVIPKEISLPAQDGLKGLLRELEDGKTIASVVTEFSFDNALMTVNKINSAFDGIKHLVPAFSLEEKFGTNEHWAEMLSVLTKSNGNFDALLSEFGDSPENMLSQCISGKTFMHWMYLIVMKLRVSEISNTYLKYVIGTTDDYSELKGNILSAIINISHIDTRFDTFYNERKELIGRLLTDKKLAESDVAAFVSDNRKNLNEGLYRLTDRTLTERKELVSLLATPSLGVKIVIDRLDSAYYALADYLQKYTFTDPKVGPELNALLTEYFDKYKKQAAHNDIDGLFLSEVESLAKERKYNQLRSRTEVLTSLPDKESSFLYWIDALGVEFLGYIQRLCERKGLSLQIHVAQAKLPTITSVNKEFYDEWHSERREKEERLDELKHKEKGGYNYETDHLPIHIAEELDIIEAVIEKAATKLALHQFDKIVIASDHGASRLAVIREQEEKYETDTKGEHGGRCCKRPDNYSPSDYDLPFATESDDGKFLVLANYGRFKGSRKANVEVHGGASLEEVIVPIIELTLANPDKSIEVVNADRIFASFRKPLEFTLFSKTELQSVRVVIKDKPTPYIATKADKTHYHVVTNIKRPGDYEADVFDGDSLIGKLSLVVQSETQKRSDGDDFDNMFN
jgi:hypothetical protein